MNCIICLTSLNGPLTSCTVCSTVFHKSCTDRAIKSSDNCSHCRQKTKYNNIPSNSFIHYASQLNEHLGGIDIMNIFELIKYHGIDIKTDEIIKLSFLYTDFKDILISISEKTNELMSKKNPILETSIDNYEQKLMEIKEREKRHDDNVAKWEELMVKREKTLQENELKNALLQTKYDKIISSRKKHMTTVQANVDRLSKSKYLKQNQTVDELREDLSQTKKECDKLKQEKLSLEESIEHVNAQYDELLKDINYSRLNSSNIAMLNRIVESSYV
jgi:hypothetical protein